MCEMNSKHLQPESFTENDIEIRQRCHLIISQLAIRIFSSFCDLLA
jgi:hypothetical protein